MNKNLPRCSLRIATEQDLPFLFEVLNLAMEPVALALGHARIRTLAQVASQFESGVTQVICWEGKDVGRLRVVRDRMSIYIGGFQIHPDFQGKGIGSAVMFDLVKESDLTGIPVSLEVHKVNQKAKVFYWKHGFRQVGEITDQLKMEYSAQPWI